MILRTSFVWEDVGDRRLQVGHRQVKLPLEQHDWRGLPQDEQEVHLESLQEGCRYRFALSRAPLMHLVLVHTDKDTYASSGTAPGRHGPFGAVGKRRV